MRHPVNRLTWSVLIILLEKNISNFVPFLRLPGPLRAVAVPMRAALHALLRAQAARLHHVADGHEALESGDDVRRSCFHFSRRKTLT